MAKLSIIIPSRDERFLTPTIDDLFRNARGEVEVVAVLDSDKWPGDWKEVAARHPNLHTIHNGAPIGMRASINRGVASAISRGATYIAKFDGHCSFGEGFDETLKAECDSDWVVVPRRLRLDPENWTIAEPDKPPYDYHYLSFPDDPQDFGGPGLNGKPWVERQVARADIPIDEEMSSQGSGWFMHADYFQRLELMDHDNYGPFWSEFQEIGLKCWLSGGKVMVNKRTHYAHLHKGKKYGRGYRLPESALKQGAGYTKRWIWNDAWAGQTLQFEWLIDHFWPVPGWPEDWREVLYAELKPRVVGAGVSDLDSRRDDVRGATGDSVEFNVSLKIHSAWYGIGPLPSDAINVAERVRSLVKDDSLDIVVSNSTLTPGSNPFRGKKKSLRVVYSYNGSDMVRVERHEKDWLIIGQAATAYRAGRTTGKSRLGEQYVKMSDIELTDEQVEREHEQVMAEKAAWAKVEKVIAEVDSLVANPSVTQVIAEGQDYDIAVGAATVKKVVIDDKPVEFVQTDIPSLWPKSIAYPPQTAPALNDYLIRKFGISPQRLKAPMPIELPNFHRNDLAQLFAELGFKRGAEIGVAEGNYSEVLLKANPECYLLLVDPWHRYSDNPQGKSAEKHEYAYQETLRKTKGYDVRIVKDYSMEAVRDVPPASLDWVYVDAQHQFDYVISDLVEWSKRVRSGGIISGDDYYQLDQKRWVGGGVVEAVQAYTNAHRIPIWYVFQGHKSVDFMWVKP